MSRTAKLTPPSLADFEKLAEIAWREIPEGFRQMAGDLQVFVADFADHETLAALEIEDPFELTGVYIGVDLTQKSHAHPDPDRVFLFRRPILDEWVERGNVTLSELIKHVLVHEIGHHFGLSDDDMHRIEDRN